MHSLVSIENSHGNKIKAAIAGAEPSEVSRLSGPGGRMHLTAEASPAVGTIAEDVEEEVADWHADSALGVAALDLEQQPRVGQQYVGGTRVAEHQVCAWRRRR